MLVVHVGSPQLPTIAVVLAQVKVVTQKDYSPDSSRAFEHFLLHTGGRGVIDELEEKLHLAPKQVQPSKDTLYRFGNTSAASTWCAHRILHPGVLTCNTSVTSNPASAVVTLAPTWSSSLANAAALWPF